MTSPDQTHSASEGPVVDEERIKDIYEELGRMHVKLDPNPIEYGPKRFNNNIAQVRAMLSRVEQLFLQVSQDLHWYKRAALREKSIFELERRHLLANDPKTRVGRSQGEREVLADAQLKDQIEKVQALEAKIHDLEMFMIVIKAKRSDLKDVQGRMRDQMKLIEHDLGMGARWGRNAGPDVLSETSNNIENMLSEADKVGGWSSDEVTDPDEQDEEEDDTEEVFLDFSSDSVPGEEEADHEPPASKKRSEEAPVIEFGAGLIEGDEDDVEDQEFDLGDVIPTEDATGRPLEDLESPAVDADDFLAAIEEEEETHDDVDEIPIDDLIATLADDG